MLILFSNGSFVIWHLDRPWVSIWVWKEPQTNHLILMVEVSQITPPVGFNLFVIQGLTGEPIIRIARYALPFFFLMLFTTAIITIFPEIALFLPELMIGK